MIHKSILGDGYSKLTNLSVSTSEECRVRGRFDKNTSLHSGSKRDQIPFRQEVGACLQTSAGHVSSWLGGSSWFLKSWDFLIRVEADPQSDYIWLHNRNQGVSDDKLLCRRKPEMQKSWHKSRRTRVFYALITNRFGMLWMPNAQSGHDHSGYRSHG